MPNSSLSLFANATAQGADFIKVPADYSPSIESGVLYLFAGVGLLLAAACLICCCMHVKQALKAGQSDEERGEKTPVLGH